MRRFAARRIDGPLGLLACLALMLGACTETAAPLPEAVETADPVAPCEGAPRNAASPGGRPAVPRAVADRHVVVVVFENRAYSDIIGDKDAPCINWLAASYGNARNSHGVAYPSLPNYIAMVSGSTLGISSNCTKCFLTDPHLGDQLEGAGLTWKTYAEGLPSPCFTGESSGRYAKKHNPSVYFKTLTDDVERCRAHVVSFDEFVSDAARDALPNFSLVIPDLCNDIHDCKLAIGDAWLKSFAEKLFATSAFLTGGVFVFTFDEDDGNQGNHIPTLVISPRVRPGTTSDTFFDHYSLLRAIEDFFGLPHLQKAGDASTKSLFEPFIGPPPR